MPDLHTVAEPSAAQPAGGIMIRPVSSLFSNSLAMGLANLLSRGVGYAYFILLARHLNARYIGAYAILVTASLLVDLTANLGLDRILIREIARSSLADGKGYFWTALPIRFAMALLSAVAAWAVLMLLFRDSLLASSLTSVWFLAAIFPIVAARNCEAFLTAYEHLLPIAASQLLERFVIFGAALLVFSGTIGFAGFLCFAPFAALARLATVAFFTAQIWTHGISSKRPDMRRLIRQATELFSVEILAQAYFRSDVFLLAKMGGLRETGIYQVTYKIFDCCLSLFSGFLQAAYPRLVRDRSRSSLGAMLAGGTGLLAIPVAVIILGRRSILGALRPEYATGSTSLVWLMLTVPLVYITTTLANAAVAAGRVRVLIPLAALLLVMNVGLNLILIPKWSINGAAFSTFACELLSAAVLGPFVLKKALAPSEQ
jgi:O-antigen/teichoic acid export membrane protein